MNKYLQVFKKIILTLKEASQKIAYTPAYRILEILKDEEDNYSVNIQLIGKNRTFYAKPEELLAEDDMVDLFSPRDIRTLTYLGYLGINAPKYKLLANRLVDDNKLVFALKKRGEKGILIKTPLEILKEKEIMASIDSHDAKTIAYSIATESFQEEKKAKAQLNKDAKQELNSTLNAQEKQKATSSSINK